MQKSLKLGSLVNLGGQVLQFSIGLLLTPIIIGELGNELFGLWVFFNTFIGLEGLFLLGTIQSLFRYVPYFNGKGDHKGLNDFIWTKTFFYTLWGGAVCSVLYFFSESIFHFFNLPEIVKADFDKSLVYLLLALFCSMLIKISNSLLKGFEEYLTVNIIQAIGLILRFLIIFFFIKDGFVVIPFALFVANFVMLVLSIMIAFKRHVRLKLPAFVDTKKYLKLSLVFGMGSVLMYIADVLRFQIDTFLLLKFLKLEDLSYYKVGSTVVSSLTFINIGIFSVLLSRLSLLEGRGDLKKFQKLSYKSFFLSTVFGTFFTANMVALAPDFLNLWIGNYNIQSLDLIYIMAIPQLIAIIQYPSINILYSKNQHHILGKLTLCEGILNFIISYILVQKIGLLGVVIGTSVGWVISKGIIIPLLLKRYVGLSVFRQVMMCLPLLIIGLISFSFSYLLNGFVNYSSLVNFLVKGICISTLYLLMTNIYYSIFPNDNAELVLIKNYIKKIL